MPSIEVDPDVMAFLAAHATPFVDTPNSVLRRVLGLDSAVPSADSIRVPAAAAGGTPIRTVPDATSVRPQARGASTEGRGDRRGFIEQVLRTEFGGRFRVRSPYQMMFESDAQLVYFQNFNASETHNLWYRLNERPLEVMGQSSKATYICLTNPAAGYAFLLPLTDVLDRARRAGKLGQALEVNIDPGTWVWRELGWDLTKHRKTY